MFAPLFGPLVNGNEDDRGWLRAHDGQITPASRFYPPKYNLRFGFPATVLASLERFISYLQSRIHYLYRQLAYHIYADAITGLSHMLTFLS